MDTQAFARHLKMVRKTRLLNQTQLAEKVGVSVAAVSTWESGRKPPGRKSLIRLADVLGVSLDALTGRLVPAQNEDSQ